MFRLSFVAVAAVVVTLSSVPSMANPHPTTHIVKMDLSIKPSGTKYGELGGYSPTILTVHIGDSVIWENVNSVTHTATSHLFPTDGRIATGTMIGPAPWSSGDVAPHQKSRAFRAAKAGVYRYSCGYHVSIGQRGVIIVLQ